MGCGVVNPLTAVDCVPFHLIGLTDNDIKQLTRCFNRLDPQHRGDIEINLLLSFYDIDDTPYIAHVFSQAKYDKDHHVKTEGRVTLRDFILCLWYFFTMDEQTLVKFTFNMFDKTQTNTLSKTQLHDWVQLAYGHNHSADKLVGLISSIQQQCPHKTDKMTFTLSDIQSVLHSHTHLIQPGLQLQALLKGKVLGYSFWKNKDRSVLDTNSYARSLFVEWGDAVNCDTAPSPLTHRMKSAGHRGSKDLPVQTAIHAKRNSHDLAPVFEYDVGSVPSRVPTRRGSRDMGRTDVQKRRASIESIDEHARIVAVTRAQAERNKEGFFGRDILPAKTGHKGIPKEEEESHNAPLIDTGTSYRPPILKPIRKEEIVIKRKRRKSIS